MARFTFLSKAMENQEEAMTEQDMADAQAQVMSENLELAGESADISRTLDVVDGITDVATIVSEGDGELSGTELDLVRASMNMAVAGTDTNASDVIPGLESYMTRSQLISAIEEQRFQILEKIMAGVGSLAKKIRNVARTLVDLTKSESVLSKEVSEKLTRLSDTSFDVKVKWQLLVSDGARKSKSEQEVYRTVHDQSNTHLEALKATGEAITSAVNNYISLISSKKTDTGFSRTADDFNHYTSVIAQVYGVSSGSGSYFVYAGTPAIFKTMHNDAVTRITYNKAKPDGISTDSETISFTPSELSAAITDINKRLKAAEPIFTRIVTAIVAIERFNANSAASGTTNRSTSEIRLAKEFIMSIGDTMDFSFFALYNTAKHLRSIGQQVLNKA